MIFYKYSHQAPDYDAWARASDEYKNAPDFAKEATMQRLSDQLSHVFGLISPSEEILADYPVTLSDYSFDNKGYFIDNLKSDMFIPFSYNGENFAVVPKISWMSKWLAVDGMPAKEIDDLRQKSPSRKDVTLTFSLLPKFASKDGTLTFDGKPYRLISAEIRSLSIYDAKGMLVWQQGAASSVSVTRPRF